MGQTDPLRLLLAADPDPRLAFNQALELLYANPSSRRVVDLLGVEKVGDRMSAPPLLSLFETARANGRAVAEEHHEGRCYLLEVRYEDGNYFVLGKDVTALRRAEQETDVMARFPAENPYPVFRITRDGLVEYSNAPARRLLQQVAGRADEVPSGWYSEMPTPAGETASRVLDQPVGERVYRMSVVHPPDANYFYVYGRDITLERRAQNELVSAKEAAEAASRTKGAFLANMSHELRTPLNAIIGYSELLQEEAEDLDVADLVPDLRKIQTAGKHLLSLINDVLDISKIEAGKMELHIESFELTPVIREAIVSVRPVIEKNQNELVVELGSDLGSIDCDRTKLRQVLVNLLSNAGKFTDQGRVELSASRTGDQLYIAVRDSGIGMSQEQVERIFSPFKQASSGTTKQFGGTGLGLAISQRFCRLLGGRINAESTPGEGSLFTVELPCVHNRHSMPMEVVPESTRVPASVAPDSDVLLVIDDDPTVHDLISRFLTPEGYRVVSTSDPAQGLALARELKPLAITLDVIMPRMDGWAVLAELKRESELAGIPVIMLTMVDERGAGLALGAADYLLKPINRDALTATIRQHRRATKNRVMVVDDDAPTRELISRTLLREGWEVIEAGDGSEALKALEAGAEVNCVVLDLMMPNMSGFEVVDQLRAEPRWKSLPIIVATAKDLTDADRERLSGRVQETLRKIGNSRQELLETLKGLVQQHSEARRSAPPTLD